MSEFKSISEIKLNKDGTASIKYQFFNQDSSQEIKFDGKEKIIDAFRAAFKNASATIGAIIEIFQRKNIEPQKITFDNKKNTVMYSFLYYPEDDLHPVVEINTPKLPILEVEVPNSNKFYVSGVDVEILNSIKAEALKYINGETRTAQIKLEVLND